MDPKSSLVCPHCKKSIELSDAVMHQFEERLEKEVSEKLSASQKELEEKLRKELGESSQKEKEELERELLEQKKKNSEFQEKELELRAQARKLEDDKKEFELKIQRQMDEERKNLEEKIVRAEEEKFRLREMEKNKTIDDLKKALDDAQRRASQGSQQLQGEVQELAIEEWLETKFPLDTIDEIKKGARGGDCIQIVNTRDFQNCGKIYYESKRTKDFQPSWIEKFKADMREKGADVGVLITDSYPKGVERICLIDGIWICSYEEFKGLASVLREQVNKCSDLNFPIHAASNVVLRKIFTS